MEHSLEVQLPFLRRALPAASTDLPHFHPRGRAQALDDVVATRIAALDGEGLLADLEAARAGAAALRDPRFSPVRPEELAGLSLELSVLTPSEPCAPEQARVGVDGLMIEARGRAGLLLPQVPSEFGWDREQYLDQLCLPGLAGLGHGVLRRQGRAAPPGAWREPGVRLMRFQAQVF